MEEQVFLKFSFMIFIFTVTYFWITTPNIGALSLLQFCSSWSDALNTITKLQYKTIISHDFFKLSFFVTNSDVLVITIPAKLCNYSIINPNQVQLQGLSSCSCLTYNRTQLCRMSTIVAVEEFHFQGESTAL